MNLEIGSPVTLTSMPYFDKPPRLRVGQLYEVVKIRLNRFYVTIRDDGYNLVEVWCGHLKLSLSRSDQIIHDNNLTWVSDWVEEEMYFDANRGAKRFNQLAIKVDCKWSDGSSPIMLIRYGFVKC